MATMLKRDLVEEVAKSAKITKKEAADAIDAVFESITKALKGGDSVLLTGFGKFEVRHRGSRPGINPKTLESIKIPARTVPVFRAGKALKASVK